MKQRCIIITSYNDGLIKDCFDLRPDDFIICADGGYALALAEGIVPHLVMGDFDSFRGTVSKGIKTVRVAAEKDDTDTMLCLKAGLSQGFHEFIICGGIGGRLDHTIANLQAIAYALDCGKPLWIHSGTHKATMIDGGHITITSCQELKSKGFKLSIFSFSAECTGVSIKGAFYPLTDATLKNNFPLGVSNEFLEDTVTISNTSGKLLIILAKE